MGGPAFRVLREGWASPRRADTPVRCRCCCFVDRLHHPTEGCGSFTVSPAGSLRFPLSFRAQRESRNLLVRSHQPNKIDARPSLSRSSRRLGRARVGRTLLSAAVAVVLWTVCTTTTEGCGSFTVSPAGSLLPIVISSAAGSSANANDPAESRNLLVRSHQPNKIDAAQPFAFFAKAKAFAVAEPKNPPSLSKNQRDKGGAPS
jgi:hypothetical protein